MDFPAHGPPVITIFSITISSCSSFNVNNFSIGSLNTIASFLIISVVGFAFPFSHLLTALLVTPSFSAKTVWDILDLYLKFAK